MKDLSHRWKLFGSMLFDPWTLILAIAVLALLWLSYGQPDPKFATVLNILIILSSTIVGARVTKQWSEINDGGIVKEKGKSAVRNLKLLLRNIEALDIRVRTFKENSSDSPIETKLIQNNFEEINEFCNLLKEEVVNSIENWTDILPELDIATQIGEISNLAKTLKDTEDEKNLLEMKLKTKEEMSAEESNRIHNLIQDKDQMIIDLVKQIDSSSKKLTKDHRLLQPIGNNTFASYVAKSGFESIASSGLNHFHRVGKAPSISKVGSVMEEFAEEKDKK
ncbi:hypothetical protein [Aliikangiella coralliicola]|uniref:Uncharacterized protein n=1 Tax=Aliikangiella coralliicola TaxID=2592383 RepID=A0A545U086_9GAMM|nr:hypothetical protein [Aliikangiella coralliicola]TQV82843.1 hypothetical protein FLL46_24040 [Aliikangiella coralliicola]